jgi:hypothetical protein
MCSNLIVTKKKKTILNVGEDMDIWNSNTLLRMQNGTSPWATAQWLLEKLNTYLPVI